ncbi:protein transport protein Sec24-like At4g32640 [Fagus crenata]
MSDTVPVHCQPIIASSHNLPSQEGSIGMGSHQSRVHLLNQSIGFLCIYTSQESGVMSSFVQNLPAQKELESHPSDILLLIFASWRPKPVRSTSSQPTSNGSPAPMSFGNSISSLELSMLSSEQFVLLRLLVLTGSRETPRSSKAHSPNVRPSSHRIFANGPPDPHSHKISQIPAFQTQDQLCWRHAPQEGFTVSPRVAFFSWTATMGRILTIDNLRKHYIIIVDWLYLGCSFHKIITYKKKKNYFHVRFWYDRWCGDRPLKDEFPMLFECSRDREAFIDSLYTITFSNRGAKCLAFRFFRMRIQGQDALNWSFLPSTGIGSLSAREAEGQTNISAGEKEAHKLLQPAAKTLKTMAIELAEYQICVDVFITTQTYVDMGSISVIPRTTGGQVYYYYLFSALSDPVKLYNDLRWNITRPQGFEAVMRVRCSQGIQVQEFHGNFCKRIPTDVDLPGIDCDKTIMVTLKHDDKLQDGSECSFQVSMNFSAVWHGFFTTLSLPCTNLLSNLFCSADLDTQFACFLKQAASKIPSTPLLQVREQVTNLCISVLFSYRKFCATVTSSGQLILTEALKLLPLYTQYVSFFNYVYDHLDVLTLMKSTGLRNDARIDDRSIWINYVSSLSTSLAIPLVYPRMVAIHNLGSKEDDESLVPPVIPLSSEHISDEGIYLLENGEDCLIYIGNMVDSNILQLLGISPVDGFPTQFVLQQYDNPLSKKLNDLINEIRRQRCSYLRLKLCKKGDPSGALFLSYLVEDKNQSGPSYVEFLVHVHREIQVKMSS